MKENNFEIKPYGNNYGISFSSDKIEVFENFIFETLKNGFWNEYLGEEKVFIFKFDDGKIKRYVLNTYNEKEILDLCQHKYDEIINENNNNISVGQKQRIAIARAILRDTPIILFDEATSALDNHSKNKIQETINELSKTKTIIMIAHSLEIVEEFDHIIMLDNGKIVEQGKHYELMNYHGKYYELANV